MYEKIRNGTTTVKHANQLLFLIGFFTVVGIIIGSLLTN